MKKNLRFLKQSLAFVLTLAMIIPTLVVNGPVAAIKAEETAKIDVWDFGAEEFDSAKYNNLITVASWNEGYTAEQIEKKTGVNLATRTVNGLTFNDGGFPTTHRLRTTNKNLVCYDTGKYLKDDEGNTLCQGYIYSNKSSTDEVYLSLACEANDIVTFYVASNGNASELNFVRVVGTKEVDSGKGDGTTKIIDVIDDSYIQKQEHTKGSSTATVMTFYAREAGTYKIYSRTEKLVVGRVLREHRPDVTVTGTVTAPAELADYKLVFKSRENGVVVEAPVADGTYSAALATGYTYDVTLANAHGYIITSAATVTASADAYNVTVEAVDLVNVSGTVSGLDATIPGRDADALNKVEIEFTSDKIYQPVIELNRTTGAYTAQFEKGATYNVVVKNIDDFETTVTTAKADEDVVIDIPFTAKAAHNVTIVPTGATLENLASATFTFIRHKDSDKTAEEGYVYTFTGTDNIKLRDGVYTVKVTDLTDYEQKLTSNAQVAGADIEKTIPFEFTGDPTKPKTWVLNTADYQEAASTGSFKGLTIVGGKWHGTQYGMTIKSGSVEVPVPGPCTIAVSVGYTWDLSLENANPAQEYLQATAAGTQVVTFDYAGEAGTVKILAGSTVASYISQIVMTPKTEEKVYPTSWDFTSDDYTGQSPYNYAEITNGAKHGVQYGMKITNGTITIPVSGPCTVAVSVGYNWDVTFPDGTGEKDKTNSGDKDLTYNYTGEEGTVTITTGSEFTSYIKAIKVTYPEAGEPEDIVVTVGATDCDYKTINEALAAVKKMNRTSTQMAVIKIQPGNYEEMLVIDIPNIKLVNASATPSIELKNGGVDIDENAVRITSYYGHGYIYYSMGSDCKYSDEILAVNKENGYPSFVNPGAGSTSGSYWNSTVVIKANNVSAYGIIFENSFNQYVSAKAANDVIVPISGQAKEPSDAPRSSLPAGSTKVQDKAYVERAAALSATDNCKKIYFDNCKFVGRQDTLYGGTGAQMAYNKCSIYGGTDFIMGPMNGAFNECDLVMNTYPSNANDVAYITAPQTKSGRGMVFYNCTVKSTTPGVDTISEKVANPGGFGRPWAANTGEAVFVKTKVGISNAGTSLILPEGWVNTLSAGSKMCAEYLTFEEAGVDNSAKRVNGGVLTEGKLSDGTEISFASFLGDWMPFEAEMDLTPIVRSEVPTSNLESGTYTEDKTVELTAAEGAQIYYTIDGSLPTTESTLYEGPIVLPSQNGKSVTTEIRAIAVENGKESSLAVAFSYTIKLKSDVPMVKKKESVDLSAGLVKDTVYGVEGQVTFVVLDNMPLKEEPATVSGVDYTGFVQGASNATPSKGAIPTAGAAFKFTATEDTSVTFVNKAASKTYHWLDVVGGEVVNDTTAAAIPDELSFKMEAGHTYYYYADGSKPMVYAMTLGYMVESDYQKSEIDLSTLTDTATIGGAEVVALLPDKEYGSDPTLATFSVIEAWKRDKGTTIDGVEYAYFVQGQNNAKVGGSSGSNGTGQITDFGSALVINAKKDCTLNLVLSTSKNKGKYYYFVDVTDNKLIEGDPAKTDTNLQLATGTKTFALQAGHTYQYYLNGSKAAIYAIYAEAGTKPRADWETVAVPVIDTANITVDAKTGDLKVPFNMVIGDDGADSVTIVAKDANGDTLTKEVSKAAGSTGSITLKMAKFGSGKVTLTISASREDEKDKEGVAAEYEYILPVFAPTNVIVYSAGSGSVNVVWDKVAEATGYKVYVDGTLVTTIEGGDKTEAVVGPYTIGTAISVEVSAVREEEEGPKCTAVEFTPIEKTEYGWNFTAWGESVDDPSSSSAKNGYTGSVNKDGKVTVYSEGGKGKIVPAGGADGLSFYYTKVPADKNFVLKAKVTVDSWTFSNGQEGFGLMASDRIYAYPEVLKWTNSYMVGANKIEYRWDPEKNDVTTSQNYGLYSMKLGLGVIARTGVTKDNVDKIGGDSTMIANEFKSVTKPLEISAVSQGTGTYNIIGNGNGNIAQASGDLLTEVTLELKKNNTGYFATYYDAEGNVIKTIKDYDTEALSKIDTDYVYVGFFAGRNARATFTDIEFKWVDPKDDEPKEEKPVTYIDPFVVVQSAKTTNSEAYRLDLYANFAGEVALKLNGEALEKTYTIEAGKKLQIPTTIPIGDNKFEVYVTPAAEQPSLGESEKLSSMDVIATSINVARSNRFDGYKTIYISPEGTAANAGTAASPVDVYTAVSFVQPGQTIVVMEGTYKLTQSVLIDRGISGTADAKIYMVADPEATKRPVFDFQKTTGVIGIALAGDYWYLKGFDVTGSGEGKNGIKVSGNYNTVDQVNTYRNGNTGLQIARYYIEDTREYWPVNNLVLNCTSHNNADAGYEDADGFAAKLTIGEGNTFDGCVAYHNADDGWDLFAKPETGSIGKVVIKNSVAYENGYIEGANGELVNAGNGNGFKMGGSGITGYHTLINSYAFYNKAKGIDSNSCPDIQAENCISYNNESYNVALYAKGSKTDFSMKGIISFKDSTIRNSSTSLEVAEQFKLDGQTETDLKSSTNYYWDGAKSANVDGKTVAADWFVSLNFMGITRNSDGTINMGDFLKLSNKAPEDAGARPAGTPSGEVTVDNELKQFVTRMYTKALNREGEESGVAGWYSMLKQQQITAAALGSCFLLGEEINNQNITDEEFVNRCYAALFDRAADEGGFEYWMSYLNSGVSRSAVYAGFCLAPEYVQLCERFGVVPGRFDVTDPIDQNPDIAVFVQRCYETALDRTAPAEDIRYWAMKIISREMSPQAVLHYFIFAEEFTAKNVNNTEYVQVLYTTFMGRTPDEAGLAYWVGELDSNRKTREDVFQDFAWTEEFAKILASFGIN